MCGWVGRVGACLPQITYRPVLTPSPGKFPVSGVSSPNSVGRPPCLLLPESEWGCRDGGSQGAVMPVEVTVLPETENNVQRAYPWAAASMSLGPASRFSRPGNQVPGAGQRTVGGETA